jgi:hypothetical protein
LVDGGAVELSSMTGEVTASIFAYRRHRLADGGAVELSSMTGEVTASIFATHHEKCQ